MTADSKKKQPLTLGFLTVREHRQHGLFGGYLLLNGNGRPVEFHCTAPVRFNRAQEILYGPTLRPYLCGEQIAATLIRKAKVTPVCVCLDVPATVCVRSLIDVPIVLCEPAAVDLGEDWVLEPAETPATAIDETSPSTLNPRFRVAKSHPQDQQVVSDKLREWLEAEFDFREPFIRINEAMVEAHKTARAA